MCRISFRKCMTDRILLHNNKFPRKNYFSFPGKHVKINSDEFISKLLTQLGCAKSMHINFVKMNA